MLGLREFYNDLKSRVSNTLISSFIISWLIFNWRIPIAFIFYNQADLIIDGYKSYFELVTKSYSSINFILIPLAFSIVYTFGYPVIRTFISAFNTKIQKWSENWNLEISKDGSIPITKYLNIRDDYKKQQLDLKELIESEGSTKEQLDKLKIDYEKLLESNSKSILELNKWQIANEVSIINGSWEFTIVNPVLGSEIKSTLNIMNGDYHFANSLNKPYGEDRIKIKWLFNSLPSRRIYLVLDVFGSDGSGGSKKSHNIFQDLRIIGDFEILEGEENDNFSVVYKRIK